MRRVKVSVPTAGYDLLAPPPRCVLHSRKFNEPPAEFLQAYATVTLPESSCNHPHRGGNDRSRSQWGSNIFLQTVSATYYSVIECGWNMAYHSLWFSILMCYLSLEPFRTKTIGFNFERYFDLSPVITTILVATIKRSYIIYGLIVMIHI